MINNSINWTAIDVIINLFDTLIIFIPAVISFVYYKTHRIDMFITSKTDSGIKLYLHNVSKNSVLIWNAVLKYKGLKKDICINNSFRIQANEENRIILPDNMISVTLDYAMLNIPPIKKGRIILYLGKHKIVKRIK
ncbi:MAG: hypothetical protein IJH32_05590 [Ruminococcus sp.]|nr:hypothetical protein [Ruminococcus sp.]